ncbi:tyrosine-type recombinase/integrase [Nonomuraea sp. NPDC023979]|uniref:tyrosine-type recombinase/integrase n=1 Tax=Nonomuraea sp. NPDC023979 TaxID=3154796 RepID=UPI0033CB6846
MTLAEKDPAGRGLLEKLMAAVRPEFRVDILFPAPDDPVLGWKFCAVPGCDRPASDYELCKGHGNRWRKLPDRPDRASFIASPGPPLRGRSEPGRCTVADCRYGSAGKGLCTRHRDRWQRSGQPDPAAWAATVPAVQAAGQAECRLSFCSLWAESNLGLCKSHRTRRKDLASLDIEEFIAECERHGKAFIDFRGLSPQLKLELQYAVQTRHDEQTVTLPLHIANWTINRARECGVASLLERTEQEWRQMSVARRRKPGWEKFRNRSETFLIYARDIVETLRDGSGWEVEYPRDIWRLAKLSGLKQSAGGARSGIRLRFDRIAQPWLRELGKRWVRYRLTSGLSIPTAASDVQALTRFSEFLTAAASTVNGLADIDRPLLERYLAWLTDLPGGVSANESRVGGLHLFFQAIRQHRWDDTLPTTAAFFTGDVSRRRAPITRHLAEHVMAQVEQPAYLDRWPYPEGRLVTIILIRCGLRLAAACTLSFDCLLHDGQGAPYLRYVNTKMEREAAVPIDEELEAEIRTQQRRVLERWPGGNPHLFPRLTGNANGQRPMSSDAYRGQLNRWLASCNVRDEQGRPVHLTPHQWRHTFATRLINRDVPQEVIRVLLDHDSMQMTAHYAKITDQTVRRRWEQATKVNIRGERVTLDPDGPLAQAQWAKTRFAMATQTLSNGYCGLPVQKSCPHANACLTCPVFITGPEFLPELREQRHRTLTLIEVSSGKGHTRVAEMNQQVLTNLDRMIGEIEKDEAEEADAS